MSRSIVELKGSMEAAKEKFSDHDRKTLTLHEKADEVIIRIVDTQEQVCRGVLFR